MVRLEEPARADAASAFLEARFPDRLSAVVVN
jgi:hypothetical protein